MAWIEGLFEKAKAVATMEKILVHYGIRFRASPQLSNLPCPLPTHPRDKDSKGSLSVNFVTNEWRCWNAKCAAFREGQRLGNPLGFVISMEQCRPADAAQKMLEWFGNESQKNQNPPLRTEGLGKSQERVEGQNIAEIPHMQAISPPKRIIGFHATEKFPAESASGGRAIEPVPPDTTARSEPVKVKGHMKEVDQWFDSLISDPPDWQKVRNAVKARLIESFKNGKAAGSI